MHRFDLTFSRIASNKTKQLQQNHARAVFFLTVVAPVPLGKLLLQATAIWRPSHGPIPNPALSVGQMSLPETKKDGPHALPISSVVSMVGWIYLCECLIQDGNADVTLKAPMMARLFSVLYVI